jgi:hypothetical protein
MLISHKLCRWLFQLTLPLAGIGLVLLAAQGRTWAVVLLAAAVIAAGLGVVAMRWPAGKPMPVILAVSRIRPVVQPCRTRGVAQAGPGRAESGLGADPTAGADRIGGPPPVAESRPHPVRRGPPSRSLLHDAGA